MVDAPKHLYISINILLKNQLYTNRERTLLLIFPLKHRWSKSAIPALIFYWHFLTLKTIHMRTLLRITPDPSLGNKAVSNGSLPQIIQATMNRLQPEAAYFQTVNGERSCFMVFDLKDPSEIPVIAEPLFQQLGARVEFSPVMNAEDLQKGLQAIAANKSELVLEQ